MKTRFANFVLVATGTVTCLALIYYLYSRDWSVPRQFASVFPVAAAGAALAMLLFASLRLRPVAKTILTGLLLSLATAVYTAELMAGAGAARRRPLWSIVGLSGERMRELETLARQSGVVIDTRHPAEVLAELHRRHIDAVPAVFLADIIGSNVSTGGEDSLNLVPLGGISGSTTVLCNESGNYVTYQSDEHGFRNPTGIWNANRVDIATLGESFVQEYCVPDGKGFVDLLRAPNRVVLNLGNSGQSSLLQLAAIREYLTPYEPKTILWFFSENIDLPDLHDESTHRLLMRYLEPSFSQHLLTRQPEVDQTLRQLVSDLQRKREKPAPATHPSLVEKSIGTLKLWRLREELALVYGIRSDEAEASISERKEYDLLSATLRQARSMTSNWGGALYFVYLPSWNRYRNGSRVNDRERARVLDIVKGLDIPVIDVEPHFRAEPDPLSLFPFRRSGHYNERGSQIVAETVLAFLSTHNRSRN